MTSFRQIEANRSNALRSTGPKTEAGKRRSRRNAVRHGLTAETIVVALEDIEDYEAFEAAVTLDYDARTAVQRELVLRLASLLWRMRRATAIETDLLQIQAEILSDHRCDHKTGDEIEQKSQSIAYCVPHRAIGPSQHQENGSSHVKLEAPFGWDPRAGHLQTDEAFSCGGVRLDDFIEALLQSFRPISGHLFVSAKLYCDPRRSFRIVSLGREMYIVFGKSRSTLAPPARQCNSDGVEDGGLPRIVLPDKNRRLSQLDVDFFNRPEVFDAEPGNAHCRHQRKWPTSLSC
jgi:hypothetical protein